MSLDVPVPDPPALEQEVDASDYEDAEVVGSDDYRRSELSEYLAAGAWEEAWERWADETWLGIAEFEIVRDLSLFGEFDFFWDDFAGRVGYHAPGIPEDWRERTYHEGLETWNQVSNINASLTELGQTVCDVLEEEYIEWESDFQAPSDLPDFSDE